MIIVRQTVGPYTRKNVNNYVAQTFHIVGVCSVKHVSVFDTDACGSIQLFYFLELLPMLVSKSKKLF